jgi:uncharacterized protein (DUF2062 family)
MSDMGDDIAKSLLKGCLIGMVIIGLVGTALFYLIKWLYYEL